jgi:hypothetical protein
LLVVEEGETLLPLVRAPTQLQFVVVAVEVVVEK